MECDFISSLTGYHASDRIETGILQIAGNDPAYEPNDCAKQAKQLALDPAGSGCVPFRLWRLIRVFAHAAILAGAGANELPTARKWESHGRTAALNAPEGIPFGIKIATPCLFL
jgi:hypothetical protein